MEAGEYSTTGHIITDLVCLPDHSHNSVLLEGLPQPCMFGARHPYISIFFRHSH